MKNINSVELKEILEKEKDAILIDVREKEEYEIEHINGSYLIPLDTICAQKIPDKSKKIIIYCRSGKRSLNACINLLHENPDLELYNLHGGIIEWKKNGFETNK